VPTPENTDGQTDGPALEHFEIEASVVFQLGESLITDSIQALMELVKNSYDADATLYLRSEPAIGNKFVDVPIRDGQFRRS
jgi:hypothetical protein